MTNLNIREVIGDPTKTRGLIEFDQGGGTRRHLPELYGSACLLGNPRRELNLQLGALGPTLSVWYPVSATH